MDLPIMTYHSIDTSGSPVSVSPDALRRHCARLHGAGYAVRPLSEALAWLGRERAEPARIAAITFDDGYASVHATALPLLASYGWRATVLPVGDYVGRDNGWPSQPTFVPRARLLSWTELAELAGLGWEIGAHSRTHPDLTRVGDAALADEMQGGKAQVEDHLGRAVHVFAYPYGYHDSRVRARAGGLYSASCTTDMGFATAASDRRALERVDMWYFTRPLVHDLVGSPGMRPYVALRGMIRRGRTGARTLLSQRRVA